MRQCHRCQSFGHVFSGCQREPRCLKCGLNHLIANCPFKGPNFPAKCANCKSAHTTNYRDCPIFQKQVELFNKKTDRSVPQQIPAANNNVEFPFLPKKKASLNQHKNE